MAGSKRAATLASGLVVLAALLLAAVPTVSADAPSAYPVCFVVLYNVKHSMSASTDVDLRDVVPQHAGSCWSCV
jgi:hypothetical protein